jgi:hypothetical protein
MIQGGTLEVRVVAVLILEEEATAAAVVAAVAAVQYIAQANLLRVNPHNVPQLNRQQDQFLVLVLAQDLDPVLYQDHVQGLGLHYLCVIKAPKSPVLAGVQVGAGARARVCPDER